MNLLRDQHDLEELQTLLELCEKSSLDISTSNIIYCVHCINIIGREMNLTTQIGGFETDHVILDMGSYVNVLTRKT